MRRNKTLILTAHCILNQNSVLHDWERAKGPFTKIVQTLISEDISIIQLPCPEFAYLGPDRAPKTKLEYDSPEYRALCKKLAQPIIDQVLTYHKHDYNILGLVGIENSPTCDSNLQKGIFVEELTNILRLKGIILRSIDIPEQYVEGCNTNFKKALELFIHQST